MRILKINYTKINIQEYNKLYNTFNYAQFDEKKVSIIDDIFSSSRKFIWKKDTRKNIRNSHSTELEFWYTYHSGIFYVTISSFEDDWYVVKCHVNQNNILLYKCDQFEGLIKCLKELIVIYTL